MNDKVDDIPNQFAQLNIEEQVLLRQWKTPHFETAMIEAE